MGNVFKNVFSAIGKFFVCIGKGYVKIPLIARIAIGLGLGALLGVFVKAPFIATLGSMFVGALKSVAPILVFVLVISALSSAGKGIGKRFAKVIGFMWQPLCLLLF